MRFALPVAVSGILLTIATQAGAGGPTSRAKGPTSRECIAANEAAGRLVDEQKMRAARKQLLVCAVPGCPKDVKADCTHQIEDLNARLPTVVFAVKTAAGQDLLEVRVTMDGELLAERLDGSALELDPGSHSVTFETAGEPAVTKTFVFHDGDKGRKEVIIVGSLPPPRPVVLAPVPEETGKGSTQRAVGLVLGGVGILGLGAGGVLGGLATSAWSKAKSACPGHASCDASAVADSQHASTLATGSTIALIAGGAVFAAGLTVFLTSPKDVPRSIGVAASPSGLLGWGQF